VAGKSKLGNQSWEIKAGKSKLGRFTLRQAQKLNAEGRTVLIDVKANVEDRRSRF
jgi:hypothetical protein